MILYELFKGDVMEKKNILDTFKQKQLDKILTKQKEHILNADDLLAGKDPSLLFYILANKLGYLLDNDPEKVLSEKGIKIRKKLNYLIKKIGPMFLSSPQIIENRNKLIDPDSKEEDPGIILPDKPVIWAANHAFKDDTLASILAAQRNAYILFGSLPQFYNTFDGITAWANGVVITNRKVKESKKASTEKSKKAMGLGADLFIFPEGVWNKSPNDLLVNFWPGIFKIAQETGADIVPIVHYIRELSKPGKNNPIHTVIDDPINISNMSTEEASELLKEKMGTWLYLMLEKYGQSTRAEMLKGYSTSQEAWENHLQERVSTTDRYDLEIELCADYRPKDIILPEDVFSSIADIKNITPENIQHVKYARQLVKSRKQNDFQRRF